MDWDPTMKVIPWVGCQSKMKSPNSEIKKKTRRRKGRNKKNEGFMVKMDFLFFLKMNNKLKFFSYCVKKNAEKVKNKIKFNHEII